jgi:hypothetical protein
MGDTCTARCLPLDPADRLSFLGHYLRALHRFRTVCEAEHFCPTEKFNFVQLSGSRPLNSTKKVSSQVKNADFRQIFRDPEYMISDLSTPLGGKRVGSMGRLLAKAITRFRLFVSSTGPAFGGFYQIMTAKAHLWRTFRVTSSVCPHVNPAEIAVTG